MEAQPGEAQSLVEMKPPIQVLMIQVIIIREIAKKIPVKDVALLMDFVLNQAHLIMPVGRIILYV
jgi:hypothetical protein